MRELAPTVWITALRKVQNPNRAGLDIVSEDSNFGTLKVSPVFHLDDAAMDVWEYIRQENLAVPTIYFSHRHRCVRRQGQCLPANALVPPKTRRAGRGTHRPGPHDQPDQPQTSPTGSGPSASRGSRLMSPTGILPRRGGSSSSPATAPATKPHDEGSSWTRSPGRAPHNTICSPSPHDRRQKIFVLHPACFIESLWS